MKATGIVRSIEACVIIGLSGGFIHSNSGVNFTPLLLFILPNTQTPK